MLKYRAPRRGVYRANRPTALVRGVLRRCGTVRAMELLRVRRGSGANGQTHNCRSCDGREHREDHQEREEQRHHTDAVVPSWGVAQTRQALGSTTKLEGSSRSPSSNVSTVPFSG